MNKILQLKDKIISANFAYRQGTPVLSDQVFDDLCDEYQKLVSEDEWNAFRDTLHEVKGKVKHPYVMGSLNKLKAEEEKTVLEFISKVSKPTLNVSAKVDGISCRLHYNADGRLESASTRGDGSFGEAITDKAKFIKGILKTLNVTEPIDIRGELVILKPDFVNIADEYANPRNAVAGFINRKDWKKEDIEKVSFIAYTILGQKYKKQEQFAILTNFGFNVAWNEDIDGSTSDIISHLVSEAGKDRLYETDGLVLCSSDYVNEDKYRPDLCEAFKINQQIGTTTVLDVEFDGPSPNGTFCPVALLDPIELGGVVVSRCTLHNLDIIEEKGIQYGSVVKILRSGDVIPKIIEVVDNPAGSSPVSLPTVCPCCGTELVRDGVNLSCPNKMCQEQVYHQINCFIKKLGVKCSAKKTLENFGIKTFDDLLEFRPDATKKMQVKLFEELQTKVFTRSKKELFAAMNFKGLSETLISRIVDFYGFDNIAAGRYSGLPNGIGEITLEKFKDDASANLAIVEKFVNDSRYSHSAILLSEPAVSRNGMSVCFTGKLNTMSRSEAEKKAVAAGFEIKPVGKKLTYLVTNDTESGSSKNRKAKELGIKVISEEEFLKMTSDEQGDISEL